MSGQFTIGQPEASTGKAHMVAVKCDLCKAPPDVFNPKFVVPQNEVARLIAAHVCKKPEKDKKKKHRLRFPKPLFTEYETGTRRKRLGPPEKEDDENVPV